MSGYPGQCGAGECLASLAMEALSSLEDLRAGLEDYEIHLRRFRTSLALPAAPSEREALAAELALRTTVLRRRQRRHHLEFAAARSRAAALCAGLQIAV